MTECYSFIKFRTNFTLLLNASTTKDKQKSSIDIFIEQCCQSSKFDTDFIEADEFN